MYEQFTNGAREAMKLAGVAARELNHPYIDVVHLLTGLYGQTSGIASHSLKFYIKEAEELKAAVIKLFPPGIHSHNVTGRTPVSFAVKSVIEDAIKEVTKLGHNYIGSEHLLLGILNGTDSRSNSGLEVLKTFQINIDHLRKIVYSFAGPLIPFPMDESPQGVYSISIPTDELNTIERLQKTFEELTRNEDHQITKVIVITRKIDEPPS